MEQGINYYLTFAHEEYGYYEQKLSLRMGLPPILLVRAVRNSDGKYKAAVRCAQSGRMLAAGVTPFNNYETALIDARTRAYAVLYNGA